MRPNLEFARDRYQISILDPRRHGIALHTNDVAVFLCKMPHDLVGACGWVRKELVRSSGRNAELVKKREVRIPLLLWLVVLMPGVAVVDCRGFLDRKVALDHISRGWGVLGNRSRWHFFPRKLSRPKSTTYCSRRSAGVSPGQRDPPKISSMALSARNCAIHPEAARQSLSRLPWLSASPWIRTLSGAS